jgi:fumarylacetoacetate (FAA) hydrolase family protein
MIHVDSVTAAVTGLLAADAVLVSSGFVLQEGEALNASLSLTPWVGVYAGNLTVDPHTLGGPQPWQGDLELHLYVQDGSQVSGQNATQRLSRAQAAVLDVLRANPTLGGTVLMWTGLSIAPYKRDVATDTWLFTNEILLRAQVRA